jgi:hypothetical protein
MSPYRCLPSLGAIQRRLGVRKTGISNIKKALILDKLTLPV